MSFETLINGLLEINGDFFTMKSIGSYVPGPISPVLHSLLQSIFINKSKIYTGLTA